MGRHSDLIKIAKRLWALDEELSSGSACSEYGKPQVGFTPSGQTAEQAGFCIYWKDAEDIECL